MLPGGRPWWRAQPHRDVRCDERRQEEGAVELGGGHSPLETDEGQNPAPGAS